MTVEKITGTRETNSLLFVLHGYTFGPQRKAMAPSEGEAMLALADRFDRDPTAWAFSNAMTKAERQTIAAALRAQGSGTFPLGSVSPEAIATIIDPVAFDPISLNDTHPSWQYRRETALETANKILARAPAEGGAREALQQARACLEWLDRRGGLGLDIHAHIQTVLADTAKAVSRPTSGGAT